jgi:hypothetical protein
MKRTVPIKSHIASASYLVRLNDGIIAGVMELPDADYLAIQAHEGKTLDEMAYPATTWFVGDNVAQEVWDEAEDYTYVVVNPMRLFCVKYNGHVVDDSPFADKAAAKDHRDHLNETVGAGHTVGLGVEHRRYKG